MYTFLSAYIYLFNCVAHTALHAEWCFAAFGGWQNIQDTLGSGATTTTTISLVRDTPHTTRENTSHLPAWLGRRCRLSLAVAVVAVPGAQSQRTTPPSETHHVGLK